MAVELAPVEELDVAEAYLDFASENYCANCTYLQQTGEKGPPSDTPYCEFWDDETHLEPGYICAEYVPQGFE